MASLATWWLKTPLAKVAAGLATVPKNVPAPGHRVGSLRVTQGGTWLRERYGNG